MAEAGQIYHEHTRIEIDENGVIWMIQNNFESDSVILDLESSSKGVCTMEDFDFYDESFFDVDYL